MEDLFTWEARERLQAFARGELTWAEVEGIFAAPEGAAALAAYRKLRANGFFSSDDRVVLFNTGTGLKYLDTIEGKKEVAERKLPTSRQIAGIIGPY